MTDYELIICEKPSAAEKVAVALADTKPEKFTDKDKVTYYKIKKGNKTIYVACAVGHLYTLKENKVKGLIYPVYDIDWKESHLVRKSAKFTQKYLEKIKELAQDADKFIVATDYDIEGEVIGLNVIRFACNQKDASRMKFSTLTKDELLEAYEKASNHIDWGLANAGETRHRLDWAYGINVSRALTEAVKTTGSFKLLSSGRVQGPALNLIVEREKEIQEFKSEPYWEIELITPKFSAWHKTEKFWDKKQADQVITTTKDQPAIVTDIKNSQLTIAPPTPFDLTSLQIEAYSKIHTTPKQTLSLAQDLYSSAYISYPRTSSQQLPPALNYKKLLEKLSRQRPYEKICEELLNKKDLRPNNGKKTDAAHPAIHFTGEIPKNISGKKAQLYDLIVRRTLASFGDPAKRENVNVTIDVNKELFIAKGSRVIEQGWYKIYEKFARTKEEQLPKLKKDEEVKIKEIKQHAKETQPPKRFTQASIIKELEKRSLGTKATRAQILDQLYERHYINDKSIQATELGMTTVETLKKYCPDLLDEKLTRHFEEEMDMIQEGKKQEETVISEAKVVLNKIFKEFKEHEEKIGKALLKSHRNTEDQLNTLGPCPKCKATLKIMYSPRTKGKFVGCSGYPNCKNIYSLPRQGLIKPLDKPCPECNHPQVYVIRAGKRPWKLCINSKCKLKEAWVKKTEEQKSEPKSESILEEPISLIKPPKKITKKPTKKKPKAKK